MDNTDYLDFDEAVAYLKTTSSTLYKWLQAGKIPGHKLGRQWRFLKEELELHVSGKAPKIQLQKEVLQFAEFLEKRAQKNSKEGMMNLLSDLSEKLIWDAYDHGVREVHLAPLKGKYEVSYRKWREGCEAQTNIEESLLKILDDSWIEQSASLKTEDTRRLYLHRSEEEVLQVRYQKVETISGPHITLMLLQPAKDILSFEEIGLDQTQSKSLASWSQKSSGLILVNGLPGSGKTTTVYSLLNEMKKTGKVIFSLEAPANLVVDGVNQVEYSARSKEDFEKHFTAICSTNPDVIALGLGSSNKIMDQAIFQAAHHAASTGILVVLQTMAASNKEAIERFETISGDAVKNLLVGSCWQELVRKDEKWKARYELINS
jgi:excisionase family DNA binding protein